MLPSFKGILIMNQADQLYEFAKDYLPGGVCASARFNAAINRPFFVSRGDGAYVYDLEGKEYVDMCMSHGASFLGHNHPRIKEAVVRALDMGIICAYETQYHSALAQKLVSTIHHQLRHIGMMIQRNHYRHAVAQNFATDCQQITFSVGFILGLPCASQSGEALGH